MPLAIAALPRNPWSRPSAANSIRRPPSPWCPAGLAVFAALLLTGAPGATQASPATGFPANPDCTDTTTNIDPLLAELFVLKIPFDATSRSHDWLWNIERKGELNSDPQALLSGAGSWSTGDVWAVPQSPADVAFSYITFADGTLYVDSSNGSEVDWGASPMQKVGDSLPVGRDAGIGLVLPDTSAFYQVQLAPGVVRTFPMATTVGGLNFAFAPIAEVNPNDAVPGACQIGGSLMNPRDPTRGGLIGYNIYRLPPCGCTPTRDDFHRAAMTDDDSDGGWIYFVDLRKFDVTIPDGLPGLPGTVAPSDLDPDDLQGLQNPDGRFYSGDEVLLFADMDNISRPRPGELSPRRGLSYWYAIQPVAYGRVSDFASAGFTVNGSFTGDHRVDTDLDGEFDAVSLNTIAPSHDSVEFYSPQAEPGNGGQDGLGLTHDGIMLIGACLFVDLTLALPATGQVRLAGTAAGGDVDLTLTTGLESARVLGYVVHRVVGVHRVRVNEKPILAQGGEANMYRLVDAAPRVRGAGAPSYVVETLLTDGSSAWSDPFELALQSSERRRR